MYIYIYHTYWHTEYTHVLDVYIYIYYNYTQCGWWRLSAELQFCETIQEDRWGQSTAVTVTLRQSKMASWQIPELNGAFDRNMIELNEKKVQCFIPALSDRLCEFLVFSRPKNCCHLQAVCENQHPKKNRVILQGKTRAAHGESMRILDALEKRSLWSCWIMLDHHLSWSHDISPTILPSVASATWNRPWTPTSRAEVLPGCTGVPRLVSGSVTYYGSRAFLFT